MVTNVYLCLGANGSTSLKQHVNNLLVTRSGSTVERGESIPRFRLDVRPLFQQQRHHIGLAPLGGDVQRGDVVLRCVVHVGPFLDKQICDAFIPVVGCDVQWRKTRFWCHVWIVLILEKSHTHLIISHPSAFQGQINHNNIRKSWLHSCLIFTSAKLINLFDKKKMHNVYQT